MLLCSHQLHVSLSLAYVKQVWLNAGHCVMLSAIGSVIFLVMLKLPLLIYFFLYVRMQ